jgi:hypothetical protein
MNPVMPYVYLEIGDPDGVKNGDMVALVQGGGLTR